MTIPSQPSFFKRIFASLGQWFSVSDDPTQPGRASLKQGFPTETQLPMNLGGIAPNRLDFNGLFHDITAHLFFNQSGGLFSWNETLNYRPPSYIFYSGKLWWCLAENGPDTDLGAIEPGTANDVWTDFFLHLASTISGGNSGGGSGGGTTQIFGGNPIGTIIAFIGSEAPAGYFICDGSTFNTTENPQLYDLLGSAILPDLQGMFLRGFKSGVSAGIGETQQDAGRASNLSGSLGNFPTTTGINQWGDELINGCFSGEHLYQTNYTATQTHQMYTQRIHLKMNNISFWGSANTANEFRPINKAVLYCIKHD
jgi:microcystin-dependent protein